MVTMCVADGLRATLVSVEEFVGIFQQVLMEEMYDVKLWQYSC